MRYIILSLFYNDLNNINNNIEGWKTYMSNILNNSDSSSLSSGLHFTLGEGDVYEFVLDGFFENKPREKKLLERLYNSGFLDLCNSHSYNDISNDLYTSIEVIKNNSGGFSCLLYPKELSKNLYGSITLFDEYLSKLIFPKEFYNGSVHYAFRKSLFAFESDYRKNLGEKYYLAIYGLLSLFVAIDKSLLLYNLEFKSQDKKFIEIWSDIHVSFTGTSNLLDDFHDSEGEGDPENSESD